MDILLTVLSRDETGEETSDPRRTLRLAGCSRLAASYRAGTGKTLRRRCCRSIWRGCDRAAAPERWRPVYGWEFVDSPRSERAFRSWRAAAQPRPSMSGRGGHHLTLFQDLGGVHHLDVRVWFADVSVLDGSGRRLDLDEFIAGGVRWWEAMYAGERSDLAPGIVGAAPEPARLGAGPYFGVLPGRR